MTQGVLVPTDGSTLANQVIPYAETFLEPEADLTLLQVVPVPEPALSELTGEILATRDEVRTWAMEAAEQELADAAGLVTIDAARVRTLIVEGDPAEQILVVADELGVGLIAMTTHGRGAVGRWLFGSVTDRVARTSSLPVLILRPDEAAAAPGPLVRRLVVPLDGSPLAEEALPVATARAKQLGVPIHLVRAVYEPTPPVLVMDAFLEDIAAAATDDAARMLESVAARLNETSIATTWSVLKGSPFIAIAGANQPGDVIVLTSHGRGGIRRWLIGSVAEKLMREAPVPIILVPAAARAGAAETGEGMA